MFTARGHYETLSMRSLDAVRLYRAVLPDSRGTVSSPSPTQTGGASRIVLYGCSSRNGLSLIRGGGGHMRKLLCLALVVAACAKEKPSTPPTPAQKFAGVWEGRSFRTPTDTGVAWAITMALDTAGNVSGSLTFTGTTRPPVPVQILELTDSTVLQDLGPYTSPTANVEVVTRTT